MDIEKTISLALQDEAKKKSNDLTTTDAAKIASPVAKKVEKEVSSVIENITNQEPWYQSRVIWGLIVSFLAQAIKYFWPETIIDETALTDMILQLVSILGIAYAGYGRIVVNKPIGQ